MTAPFYDLPSPDDERDEDERLSREDWLAQYGSTRTAPAVMSDALPPRAAPTAPAPAQLPEGSTFNEKDVWGALATKNAPKPELAPAPTPSEQMQAEGQKQKALGNEDKAARAFVRATQMGAQENASAGAANQRPVPELVPVTKGAVGQAQRPATQGAHGVDLERPPEYQAPNAGGYWIALIADAMLNKGRGMGRIVQGFAERPDAQHVNYQRRMQHEKDVAGIEATQRRGTLTPEEEAMRQKRIEIAEANLAARQGQIDNQTRGIALREEKQRAEMEPGSPQAERIAEQLEARGVPSDRLRDAQGRALSIYEQKQLSPAIKNEIELAMGEQMNALAADKARATAEATEDSRVRVAGRTAEVTQPYKIEQAREIAGVRAGEREAQAALDEDKTIRAERRKRAAAQMKEYAALNSLRERLQARAEKDGTDAKLPAQGSFIERGVIRAKKSVLGGSGMSPDDTRLDNDLTAAGLGTYINTAGNAPNSEREQDVASITYRGNGTVGSALQSIDARIAQIESGEDELQEREDAGRMRPAPKRAASRRAPAPNASDGIEPRRFDPDAEREVDDLYGGY